MQSYSIILKKQSKGRFYVIVILQDKRTIHQGECWFSDIEEVVAQNNIEDLDYHYEFYHEIKKESYDGSFYYPNSTIIAIDGFLNDILESKKEIKKIISETIKNKIKPTPFDPNLQIPNTRCPVALGTLNFFRYIVDLWEVLYEDGFLMWEDGSPKVENLTYQLPFTWQIIGACIGNGYKNSPEQKIDIKNFDSQRQSYELYFTVEITFTEDNTKEYCYFTIGSGRHYEKYLRTYFEESPDIKIIQPCAWGFFEFYYYELVFRELNTIVSMVAGGTKLEVLTKFSTFWDCPNLLNYQLNYPLNTPNLYYFDGNVEIIE